jgi:hypothetical protein
VTGSSSSSSSNDCYCRLQVKGLCVVAVNFASTNRLSQVGASNHIYTLHHSAAWHRPVALLLLLLLMLMPSGCYAVLAQDPGP